MKVRDVMTHQVITARPEMTLRDLALLLSEHRISGMPVVDASGSILGIVSEADILVKERGNAPSHGSGLSWLFGERAAPDELRQHAATTVGQAMTRPAICIDHDRPLREAAALMLDRSINRLPVTENGLLVGILTRADLVRAYLRRDDEARDAIRDQVLRKTMWLNPDDMRVEVHEGIARLAGTVDRRSTAAIIERLVWLVDGVDQVESDLGWELDDSEALPADTIDHEPGAASLVTRERPRPLRG
ncbi:MAG: CBS domain-containing protein [Candidatus Limnocylindria bacterium]